MRGLSCFRNTKHLLNEGSRVQQMPVLLVGKDLRHYEMNTVIYVHKDCRIISRFVVRLTYHRSYFSCFTAVIEISHLPIIYCGSVSTPSYRPCQLFLLSMPAVLMPAVLTVHASCSHASCSHCPCQLFLLSMPAVLTAHASSSIHPCQLTHPSMPAVLMSHIYTSSSMSPSQSFHCHCRIISYCFSIVTLARGVSSHRWRSLRRSRRDSEKKAKLKNIRSMRTVMSVAYLYLLALISVFS